MLIEEKLYTGNSCRMVLYAFLMLAFLMLVLLMLAFLMLAFHIIQIFGLEQPNYADEFCNPVGGDELCNVAQLWCSQLWCQHFFVNFNVVSFHMVNLLDKDIFPLRGFLLLAMLTKNTKKLWITFLLILEKGFLEPKYSFWFYGLGTTYVLSSSVNSIKMHAWNRAYNQKNWLGNSWHFCCRKNIYWVTF